MPKVEILYNICYTFDYITIIMSGLSMYNNVLNLLKNYS